MKLKSSAIILSGGKNSRMNYKTKAFLTINSEYFLERIIKSLDKIEDVIISCNNLELYRNYKEDIVLVEDEYKDIGPVGGIYSALKRVKTDRAIVIAADMPCISSDIINTLVAIEFKGDALIPIVNGKEQPLCGVYKRSSLEKLHNEIIKENYRMKEILKKLEVTYIIINDSKVMTNINTPEEYKKIIKENSKGTVINVVASCSNVGKTTVIVGLIKELKRRGYSIATIKHDVHGFDIDKEGKDTYKHRIAGAESVCISSKNRFAIIKEVKEEIPLNKIITAVKDYDFIIVEGYKNSNLRKIEVARKKVTTEIITNKDLLIALASDFNPSIDGVKTIDINDYSALADIVEQEKNRCIQ